MKYTAKRAALRVLRDPGNSKAAKVARGEALTQRRVHAEWDDDEPVLSGQTVVEDCDDNWSGLFDHEGNPLFRVKDPIGFIK